MSCKSAGSCDSDEPVTRLKDPGRLRPPKKPASRHVVNPNFMFFCQIVLLVIPLSVLYAGLYFMNISSSVIVLVCGAIVFLVLCIFMFVRPFKEETCEENKPLRRSYEYSPLKHPTAAEPTERNQAVRPEMPKPDKSHHHRRERHDEAEKNEGDDVNDDDEECSTLIQNVSTDTLLSIATSEPSGTAQNPSEVPMAEVVTSADWRCQCCLMGCRGPTRNEVFPEYSATLPDGDGRSTGCSLPPGDRMTGNGLSVIEEEKSTIAQSVGSPCSEYSSAKLLIPDKELSDTANPSKPATSNVNGSHSLSTQQSSRRVLGYTTESSSVGVDHGTPCRSSRKTKSPQRFDPPLEPYLPKISSPQNQKRPSDAPCARLCPPGFGSRNNSNQVSPPLSATMVERTGQHVRQGPSTNQNHYRNVHSADMEPTQDGVCNTKTYSSSSYQPGSSVPSQNAASEKPAKAGKKKGCLDECYDEPEKLAAPGKQNIFADDSPNSQLSKSVKDQGYPKVKFQICPDDEKTKEGPSSAVNSGTKQPILIKLFPTSSKDGIFSWDTSGGTRPSSGILRTANGLPSLPGRQCRTTDESVQTIPPETVDTQTSAVFPNKERSFHYNVPDSPKDGPRHSKTGSVVDFVLRPFSRRLKSAANADKHSRRQSIETNEKTMQCDSLIPQETTVANTDSSKFDLLRIQSRRTGKPVENRVQNKPASPQKEEKSHREGKSAQMDICSIYYSSMQGKLYQPTRSGLLVTESSKEEVEKPLKRPKVENAGTYQMTELSPRREHTLNTDTKHCGADRCSRRSDEATTSPKCAKHDQQLSKWRNRDAASTWQQETLNGANNPVDSNVKDNKITLMFPPFELDFSSGPWDEDSKVAMKPEDPCKAHPADHKSKRSPGNRHRPKGQQICQQMATTLFRASSSSYENVVVEKVIKQKKRTLRKFK